MQIGISTATFFGKTLTEDTIAILNSWGIPVAEIFLTTHYEYTPEFASLLAARKGNVKIHSVHSLTTQFEPQLYNPAPRTRADAEKSFREVCAAAKTVGAEYYTFHGPAFLKRVNHQLNYPALGERTRKLTEICAEYGVKLAYENVHWCYYNTIGYFSRIHEYAPLLAGTLDIKQAMQSDLPYKDYIRDMGTALATVHLCDYLPDKSPTTPLKGCFDYETLFKTLRDYGYDGPLLLELYSRNYDSFDEVMQSYDYLRNILAKLNCDGTDR